MTHDELLAKFTDYELHFDQVRDEEKVFAMLRAVVELHKNNGSKYTLAYNQVAIELCEYCRDEYPCPTIQAIEKELS